MQRVWNATREGAPCWEEWSVFSNDWRGVGRLTQVNDMRIRPSFVNRQSLDFATMKDVEYDTVRLPFLGHWLNFPQSHVCLQY